MQVVTYRRRYALDLLLHLVAREFRLRYRRALLGWLWVIGQPLARLVILSFLFSRVIPLDIPNYPAFLFTGLIAWTWFSAGLARATSSAIDSTDLVLRPGLPRPVIPVVTVLTNGLDYLAALPVLAVFLLLGDGIPLTALALPVVLLAQFLLTVGLGYALCSANVYLRDVGLFVELALLLGFYLTPVFYDPAVLAEQFPLALQLNPMAGLLAAYRSLLIDGTLPPLGPFLLLFGVCAAVYCAGLAIYRASSPNFADEL